MKEASGSQRGRPPVVRLTSLGSDRDTPSHPGDELGYGMSGLDDCLAAAIATVTQVPIDQVPALELDKLHARGISEDQISFTSWQRIEGWAKTRGLELTYHDQVPAPRARWIGVVPAPSRTPKPFADHCLVMANERLLFDPARDARWLQFGMRLRIWTPDDVRWGISFDPKEE